MAKAKAAKKQAMGSKTKSASVEPRVIVLAEQLGTFFGRAQKKVDGVLENPAVRQRAGQIRDGATELLKQANRAGAAASKSATKLASAAKTAITPGASAKKVAAAKKASAAEQKRLKSRAPVAAPGKKHRKPPPQEKVDRRMGESKAMLMGQKGIKGRMKRGGRSSN